MPTKRDLIERCRDYRENLKKIFTYLAKNDDVRRHCGAMQAGSSNNADILRRTKDHWRISIEGWRIPLKSRNICGVPGVAEIQVDGETITHDGILEQQSTHVSLLLTPSASHVIPNGYDAPALREGEPFVVRHFHFDYDLTIKPNDRPRAHLQYGGTFKASAYNPALYYLFSSLKPPRVPYAPYDVILSLDLFLTQFDTPLRAVRDDSVWASGVLTSERLWLSGYYNEVAAFLGQTSRTSLHARQHFHIDWLET